MRLLSKSESSNERGPNNEVTYICACPVCVCVFVKCIQSSRISLTPYHFIFVRVENPSNWLTIYVPFDGWKRHVDRSMLIFYIYIYISCRHLIHKPIVVKATIRFKWEHDSNKKKGFFDFSPRSLLVVEQIERQTVPSAHSFAHGINLPFQQFANCIVCVYFIIEIHLKQNKIKRKKKQKQTINVI